MSFAAEFQDPDNLIIKPEKFAEALHLGLHDLAKLAGVHRTTVTQVPDNAKLQSFLRDAVRAMSAAHEITRDRNRAIYWFRNSPIPEFNHQTPENIVAARKTDAIMKYLTSIASASTG